MGSENREKKKNKKKQGVRLCGAESHARLSSIFYFSVQNLPESAKNMCFSTRH